MGVINEVTRFDEFVRVGDTTEPEGEYLRSQV